MRRRAWESEFDREKSTGQTAWGRECSLSVDRVTYWRRRLFVGDKWKDGRRTIHNNIDEGAPAGVMGVGAGQGGTGARVKTWPPPPRPSCCGLSLPLAGFEVRWPVDPLRRHVLVLRPGLGVERFGLPCRQMYADDSINRSVNQIQMMELLCNEIRNRNFPFFSNC